MQNNNPSSKKKLLSLSIGALFSTPIVVFICYKIYWSFRYDYPSSRQGMPFWMDLLIDISAAGLLLCPIFSILLSIKAFRERQDLEWRKYIYFLIAGVGFLVPFITYLAVVLSVMN